MNGWIESQDAPQDEREALEREMELEQAKADADWAVNG
jgi:hypothetical protein